MELSYLDERFNLRGRVVFITGARGQIGRELCSSFSKVGCQVVGGDIDVDTNKVDHLEGVEYVECDITNKEVVHNSLADVFEKYGRVDVLVNNAGVNTFELSEERPEDKFDWVMDVNLKGTFFCIQAYVRLLKETQQKGCIINTASHYGVVSPDFRIYTDLPRRNSEVYGATKAGIIQMTKYFSVELADRGVRVNCVSPGGIYNPESPQGDDFIGHYSYRCPQNRMGKTEEVTGAYLYLASDMASYTTGQNIIVDGGFTSW